MKHLSTTLGALLLVGCGGTDEPAGGPAEPPGIPVASVASNAGGFHATLRADTAEPPLNEEFVAHIQLRSAEGGELLDVTLEDIAIDARMPQHGHGMNVDPELTLEDGWLVARGMLFHMIGHWELYVDVTRGPITERAQFEFELR